MQPYAYEFSLISTSNHAKALPPTYATDGNCMNISQTGTTETLNLSLSYTYYVPNLTCNLVSVGQLCDLSLTVSFSLNDCHVQDLQMGRTISTGCKVGRLFELMSLQLPYPSFISTPVTDSDTYQWHLRLGHAFSEKLHH